jgi:acyl carrier protein
VDDLAKRSRGEVMKKIIDVLKDIRPEIEFEGIDDFFDRGVIDSFDLTMLVSGLEEHFGIAIDGADIVPENFRSIEAITSLLTRCGVEF